MFQAFYFIMKSLQGDLYGSYHTTWVALFHMTLGEYEVRNYIAEGFKMICL